ncbi:dnaJ homolog subfamily C member 24 [Gastrophryne carolinensis]
MLMASNCDPPMDWYGVLGAHPSDSPAMLKQKYQKLALLYHPDKQHGEAEMRQSAEAAQRFIEINQAWKILGNEETKRVYDLLRRDSEMTQSCPVDNQIQLEEMYWEKDEEYYYYTCRCGGRYILEQPDPGQCSLVNCDSCSLIIEIYQGTN